MIQIDISILLLFIRGTVDDTELVEGLVLEQKISHLAGGISQVEKAKIGLIQFCISPPKTDVSGLYSRISDCALGMLPLKPTKTSYKSVCHL